jgi:hypothetical protein
MGNVERDTDDLYIAGGSKRRCPVIVRIDPAAGKQVRKMHLAAADKWFVICIFLRACITIDQRVVDAEARE